MCCIHDSSCASCINMVQYSTTHHTKLTTSYFVHFFFLLCLQLTLEVTNKVEKKRKSSKKPINVSLYKVQRRDFAFDFLQPSELKYALLVGFKQTKASD